MNITKILTFAMALGMFFTSCEKNEIEETATIVSSQIEVGYASIYLEDTYAFFTKAGNEKETGAETAEERKIHTVSFYIFDENGNRDTQNGYTTFNYTGNQYTFAVTAGQGKTILIAANATQLGDLGNADLETVRDLFHEIVLDYPLDVRSSGLTMAGEVSDVHVKKGDIEVVKVCVSRMYNKFDFTPKH